MKKKNPYSVEEERISYYLTEAFNHFNKLKPTCSVHKKEFSDGIHKCQHVLIHRIVQREYPKHFPTAN